MSDIRIMFKELQKNVYGTTRVDSTIEKGNVLRITNRREELKSTMKTAVVHEYFHYAQKNTILNNSIGKNLLYNGVQI